MDNIYIETPKGFVVKPNSKIQLPGVFKNIIQAERAYAKYIAQGNVARKQRKG